MKAAEVAEAEAFWDWALLELLLQSGVRIEEAGELTTLDVLRRRHSDGRVYYMLHVKPSKYDRARVIPIGDGLGRVIAEIIRHVKRFYGTDRVPACDHYDSSEKVALPRAPYLLQGCRHPSAIAYAAIRSRLARLSQLAGVTCADGSPLIVRPHDCRRLFASEHLNNNTPVHVIQALLGHASIDTVMVYAKLYPSTLVEERPGRSPHASWRSSGSRAPCAAPTNSPMVSPARSRAKPHKPKPRTQARAIEGRMGARRRRPTRPSHAIDTRVAGSLIEVSINTSAR